MTDLLALTAWTIYGALLTGLMLALLGSLKKELASRPKQSVAPLSGDLFLLNVLPVVLLVGSGLIIDRTHWGVRPTQIGGNVVMRMGSPALATYTRYIRTLSAGFAVTHP